MKNNMQKTNRFTFDRKLIFITLGTIAIFLIFTISYQLSLILCQALEIARLYNIYLSA